MGDAHDFRIVNDFARETGWLHPFFAFWATWGVVLFALPLAAGWLLARRYGRIRDLAGYTWAVPAAGLALLINQPIVAAVHERRPFLALPHVLMIIQHAPDPGFPSDHATAAGALATAVVATNRRLGIVGGALALLIAFARVYAGVHYPVDVLAGLGLGAIVALAVRPIAIRLLERPMAAIGRSGAGFLVISPQAAVASSRFGGSSDSADRDVPDRTRFRDMSAPEMSKAPAPKSRS